MTFFGWNRIRKIWPDPAKRSGSGRIRISNTAYKGQWLYYFAPKRDSVMILFLLFWVLFLLESIINYLGSKDGLALAIVEAYRYRSKREQKENVLQAIKTKSRAGEAAGQKERQKRLKNMYLVNKVKFFGKATEEELQEELDTGAMDEDKHRILQHRIR